MQTVLSISATPTGANKLTTQIKAASQTAAEAQMQRFRNKSSNKKVKAIRNRFKKGIVRRTVSKIKMTSTTHMIPLCLVSSNS